MSEAKRDRPVKRQRVMDPESEEDGNSTGVGTPRRKAVARPGMMTMAIKRNCQLNCVVVRTPSTSPPPEPPKEEYVRMLLRRLQV